MNINGPNEWLYVDPRGTNMTVVSVVHGCRILERRHELPFEEACRLARACEEGGLTARVYDPVTQDFIMAAVL